jgi:hypothetical protein
VLRSVCTLFLHSFSYTYNRKALLSISGPPSNLTLISTLPLTSIPMLTSNSTRTLDPILTSTPILTSASSPTDRHSPHQLVLQVNIFTYTPSLKHNKYLNKRPTSSYDPLRPGNLNSIRALSACKSC